ncbi:hypothetical protein OE88DRAFT_1781138 [Heliocybe sulcata]|uniref:Uncharacterized protein n=1 Tax=Heliocybe sulcata TaxID=5364 RepID=A0A5C3MQ56_9AGAM|nr:hypothetical protein OE88DRAFT_1781138 [Heliocybe sulcata]
MSSRVRGYIWVLTAAMDSSSMPSITSEPGMLALEQQPVSMASAGMRPSVVGLRLRVEGFVSPQSSGTSSSVSENAPGPVVVVLLGTPYGTGSTPSPGASDMSSPRAGSMPRPDPAACRRECAGRSCSHPAGYNRRVNSRSSEVSSSFDENAPGAVVVTLLRTISGTGSASSPGASGVSALRLCRIVWTRTCRCSRTRCAGYNC